MLGILYRFQVYSMCMAEICSIGSIWPKDVYDGGMHAPRHRWPGI
jgi:hypothetical protein